MYTVPCHYLLRLFSLSRLFVAHYLDIGFSIIARPNFCKIRFCGWASVFCESRINGSWTTDHEDF